MIVKRETRVGEAEGGLMMDHDNGRHGADVLGERNDTCLIPGMAPGMHPGDVRRGPPKDEFDPMVQGYAGYSPNAIAGVVGGIPDDPHGRLGGRSRKNSMDDSDSNLPKASLDSSEDEDDGVWDDSADEDREVAAAEAAEEARIGLARANAKDLKESRSTRWVPGSPFDVFVVSFWSRHRRRRRHRRPFLAFRLLRHSVALSVNLASSFACSVLGLGLGWVGLFISLFVVHDVTISRSPRCA